MKMFKRQRIAALQVVLVGALFLPMQGCTSQQLKQAQQASQTITTSCATLFALTRSLNDQKLLTDAQSVTIARALLVVVQSNDQFRQTAITYTSWDSTSKANLAKLFQDVVAGVTKVQGSVAALTNTDAQKALAVAVAALNAAATTLNALLTGP